MIANDLGLPWMVNTCNNNRDDVNLNTCVEKEKWISNKENKCRTGADNCGRYSRFEWRTMRAQIRRKADSQMVPSRCASAVIRELFTLPSHGGWKSGGRVDGALRDLVVVEIITTRPSTSGYATDCRPARAKKIILKNIARYGGEIDCGRGDGLLLRSWLYGSIHLLSLSPRIYYIEPVVMEYNVPCRFIFCDENWR